MINDEIGIYVRLKLCAVFFFSKALLPKLRLNSKILQKQFYKNKIAPLNHK